MTTSLDEGLERKCFRLRRPDCRRHSYSGLTFQPTGSHRQYINEWGWQWPKKSLFTKTDREWIWPSGLALMWAFESSPSLMGWVLLAICLTLILGVQNDISGSQPFLWCQEAWLIWGLFQCQWTGSLSHKMPKVHEKYSGLNVTAVFFVTSMDCSSWIWAGPGTTLASRMWWKWYCSSSVPKP